MLAHKSSLTRRSQGFGSLPISRHGLRKLPTRQSMSSLWTPYCLMDFNHKCGMSPAIQAHKSLYLQHGSLALLFRASDLLPSFWNNTNHLIQSLIINLHRFPSIRRTIYITSLYLINTIGLLHSRTRDRLNTFPRHRRARHQSGASHPQQHEVARRPRSTYCGP